jgi:mono/diheme cytochrome c family protein
MRQRLGWVLVLGCVACIGMVNWKSPNLANATGAAEVRAGQDEPASEPATELELKPVDVTMHDFMEGAFQFPYRRLKELMATEPTALPAWKAIRSDALILAEGGNLLLIRTPKEDGADWNRYSIESRDAGQAMIKAAKKKDFEKTTEYYKQMLVHCNACHDQFANGKHQLEP